jgi:hypothetical protein
MDPKNRAAFINSVGRDAVFCPECGAKNEPGSKFCAICGTTLEVETDNPAATSEPQSIEASSTESSAHSDNRSPKAPVGNDSPKQHPSPLAFTPDSQGNTTSAPAKHAFSPTKSVENDNYSAPPSAFANGLPSWDLVPPLVVIHKKAAK